MGAEVQARQAATAVRKIIQKVRLANPENFDELEAELLQQLESKLGDLGEQFEKVQEEADKGLALGRKHVEQVLQKREKEEAVAERPKQLLQEHAARIAMFEEKIVELKAAACLDGGSTMSTDDAPLVEKLAGDFQKQMQEFTKSAAEFVVTNQLTFKAPTLPAHMKAEFDVLAKKVDAAKKDAAQTVMKAKETSSKILAGAKKEMLDKAKLELRERLREASAPVAVAEQAVEKAEKHVEPFSKIKNRAEEEMLALAEEADEAIKAAIEAVKSARDQISPPDQDVDEAIKAELKSWLAAEAKRPEIRLGQMDRRIARAKQLVRTYRREANKSRNVEFLRDLKPQLLEKAKAAAANPDLVNGVDAAIKEAEKAVEPFAKGVGKLSLAEMRAVGQAAAEALEAAKGAMAAARGELRPIDESLDEDLKKELNAFLTPEVKKHELRLGQMERRLTRATNLLATFERQMASKTAARTGEARGAALQVLRHNCEAKQLSAEELFVSFDADSSGTIDEAEFLAFFETADRPEGLSVDLTPEELKSIFTGLCKSGTDSIPQDAFEALFSNHMKVVKPTPLTTDVNVAGGKVLRALRLGEVLKVLDGPKKDGTAGLSRVKVQPVSAKGTATPGWATVISNAGTVFLQECSAAEAAKL